MCGLSQTSNVYNSKVGKLLMADMFFVWAFWWTGITESCPSAFQSHNFLLDINTSMTPSAHALWAAALIHYYDSQQYMVTAVAWGSQGQTHTWPRFSGLGSL